ncbi:MAG: SPOR domain-containing protein, partial [Alphaproteobacteria bacterium]
QVWSNTVPRRLIASAPAPAAPVVWTGTSKGSAPAPARVRASTKRPDPAAPAAAPVQGRAFVQVGAFADPANARRARLRLEALGLPVTTRRLQRGGRPLTRVLAGPVAGAQLRAVLGAARAAGYRDAFVTR